MRLHILATAFATLASFVAAQSETDSSTESLSYSVSLTTSTATITTTTRANNQNTVLTSTFPTTLSVTYTVTPTADSAATESASETALPISLDTRVDPAFGVLGAVLILTGLPSAFLGHKNRWTSFFLTGFYTLSLTCFVLILKFGVMDAVNPPSATLRGMFVLSCVIAGIAGGGIAIFFWKGARYCIGAWGGLAFGFWIQCFRDGGVIRPVGFRWIMYIGCAVVGFVLCTIPKLHYHAILVSTAFLGASVIMLGVDCYTTAGLKEFYVWNIGFNAFFKTFTNNGIQFPVSQSMQIELGLIGAIALIGAAVQLRILNILQHKIEEIAIEQRRRDAEADGNSTALFARVEQEKAEWEREHGDKPPHARTASDYSSMPLMKDIESSPTPTTPEFHASNASGSMGRQRLISGISDYMSGRQSPGALPALELGLGVEDSVPQAYISNEPSAVKRQLSPEEQEALKKKQELEAEIEDIRRSIDVLKSDTPSMRRPSLSSKRTLSMGADSVLLPMASHLRPPRAEEPSRNRVRSMELGQLVDRNSTGVGLSRPSSTPLLDDSWNQYLEERKLMQPPSGVTQPILPTGPTPPPTAPRGVMAPAVVAALKERRRMEHSMSSGSKDASTGSSEDIPLSKIAQPHARRRSSMGGNVPVNILPPKKPSVTAKPPSPVRSPTTRTFEELNDRHREKMKSLQDPVTSAQKEQAALYEAKQRWERNKALEKEAVMRRQAEKAADRERRMHSDDEPRSGGTRAAHGRSLSADKLAALGNTGSSRKLGNSKVEDWQRYQETSQEPVASRRRDSRPIQADDGRRKSRGPIN